MSDETLFTAARRLVRFVRIDEADGGLLSNDTVRAAFILARLVDVAATHLKASTDPRERAQVIAEVCENADRPTQ